MIAVENEAKVKEQPEKAEESPKETTEKALEVKKEIEKVGEEIAEERFYTVPLGRAWLMPPNKRAPKAMRILKEFVKRHMKLKSIEGEEEDKGEEQKKLFIDNKVNEKIWSSGIEKPPRKIRIRAVKDKDGNVRVYLAEGD